MKKTSLIITSMTLVGLAVIFLSCTKISEDTVDDSALKGRSSQSNSIMGTNCDFTAVLTETEIQNLMHMREEEKVARDVYLAFYDMYKMQIFSNIAKSEQRHMDAVLGLIEGYGLTDPADGKEAGEFTPDFQSLHDALIAEGTTLVKALEVGVKIEEMDIADLTKCISETETANIIQVYNNLLAASQNHLKAFKSKL
jgi:hypothetical protein